MTMRVVNVWLPFAAFVAVSVLLGGTVVVSPQAALVLLVGILGFAALGAPTYCWVVAAAVSAITFPGIVGLGVLPSVATFVSIPVAWGALAAALLQQKHISRVARVHLICLAALATAVLFAWLVNFSDPLRPILDLALLGQPFALIGAILVDPPSPSQRRVLVATTVGLIGVQVPFVLWQVLLFGRGDPVQGTLYSTGAGAHVVGGIAALGALWLLSGGRSMVSPGRAVLGASLLAIPFLSDAKQVIFALPVAIALAGWRGGKVKFLLRAAVVGVSVFVLATQPALNHGYAIRDIKEARSGGGGKIETARSVWAESTTDPATFIFGKGPAETVSRAAFMTTSAYQKRGSALRNLGLQPAETALALQSTRPQGSFEAPISSMIGVFGDLGLVGAASYGALLLTLFFALQRSSSSISRAAQSGLGLFFVLGFVAAWWEEPGFTVVVALLVGLALCTDGTRPSNRQRLVSTGDRGLVATCAERGVIFAPARRAPHE